MKKLNYNLSRATMHHVLADMYASIFPDYKKAHDEEMTRLKALSDEEYSAYLKRISESFADMPCPECGCEVNGNHEEA